MKEKGKKIKDKRKGSVKGIINASKEEINAKWCVASKFWHSAQGE
jgi:hypothetical protein